MTTMEAAKPHSPASSVDTNIAPTPSTPFRIVVFDGTERDFLNSENKLSSELARPPLTVSLWDGLDTDSTPSI